jgi:hypothetical protein
MASTGRVAQEAIPEYLFSDEILEALVAFVDDPLGFAYWAFPWNDPAYPELCPRPGENEPMGLDAWQVEFLTRLTEKIQRVRAAGGDVNAEIEGAIRQAAVSGHGTGKTTLVCFIILWFLSCRSHPLIIVTANTQGQLSSTVWRTLAKWKRLCITGPMFEWTATKIAHKAFNEDWYALAVPWSENNAEAFAGKHEQNIMFIFDEASKIADIIWETAEGGLTTRGAIMLAFGNGTQNTGRFYELSGRFRHRWDTMEVDSRECRFADKAQIRQWEEDYGEDSDFFRVRVLGKFPHSAFSQLISTATIAEAQKRYRNTWGDTLRQALAIHGLGSFREEIRRLNPAAPLILTVDVARMGGDLTAIGVRCGQTFQIVAKFRELKQPELVAHIANHIQQLQPDAVFIDGHGYGQGAIDQLEMDGFAVQGAYAGQNSSDPRQFFNKRAEMYKGAERWLANGGMIDDKDVDLETDLREVQYGFAKRQDTLQIETKDDARKRGVASPDCGDTLSISFYLPVAQRARDVETVADAMQRIVAEHAMQGGALSWRSN